MSRRFLDPLAFALPLCLLLNACLEQDYKTYGLNVQARGLASNESITVSNGTSLEISGTNDLSWTEAQKFKKGYREDRPDYKITITRQPSNSNKVCRVLNPVGRANYSTSVIRIECGYPVVVADNALGTMTSDNGLMISNGLQTIALNSSRSLVTSIVHTIVQDPQSNSINDKKLELVPVETNGAAIFQELYLEGEQLTLSHSSINQGCEISGADNTSTLTYSFPMSDNFMDTIQTIPLNKDWIQAGSEFSQGRTCNDFMRSPIYYLDFACKDDENDICRATESGSSETQYIALCYPAPMIEVTCGLALQINVVGLGAGETVTATAIRNPSGSQVTHIQTIGSNGQKTFNLAFNNGEDYEITLTSSSSTIDCLFDPSDTNAVTAVPVRVTDTITSNTAETLRCTPVP